MLADGDSDKLQRVSTFQVAGSSTAAPESRATAAAEAPRVHKNVIRHQDVEDAIKKLELMWGDLPTNAPSLDQDGDASWGPIVLCESITLTEFERWLDNNEDRLRRWVFEPLEDGSGKGRIVLYSLPSAVHSKTSRQVFMSIIDQIMAAGNDFRLNRTLRGSGDGRCRTGNRTQEPNDSIVPVGLTVGGAVLSAENNLVPYPTVIIEISYKNEALAGLQAKLLRWMDDTSVQVAIGIKIFALGLRRVAILHQRGLPIQEVEFGEPLLPPLEISFPLASIYTGVPLPPILAALDNPQITIDLLALRIFIAERIFEERGNVADLEAAAAVAAPAGAE